MTQHIQLDRDKWRREILAVAGAHHVLFRFYAVPHVGWEDQDENEKALNIISSSMSAGR